MNYAIERQLTIAIENQPGRPAAIARRVMAAHGISVLDTVEQGDPIPDRRAPTPITRPHREHTTLAKPH